MFLLQIFYNIFNSFIHAFNVCCFFFFTISYPLSLQVSFKYFMQFPSEIRYSIGLFFMQSWVLKLGIKLPNKYRELSKLPIHIGHVLISFLDELAYFILTMKYTCVKLIIVFCHSCSLYSCFLPCPWGMLSVWSVLMPPNLSKGYVFMLMPPVSSIKYLCGLCWCLLPCPQGMLAV